MVVKTKGEAKGSGDLNKAQIPLWKLLQLVGRVQRDLGIQQFRNGAAALRVVGSFFNGCAIGTGGVNDDGKMAGRNGESAVGLFESNGCRGFNILCSDIGFAKLRGKRHGKTTGVSGG